MIIKKIKDFLVSCPEFRGRLPSNLGVEDRLIESGILDSFDVISLVSFIEETFLIRVEGEDLISDNFETLSSLERYITKKIQECG